MSTSTKVVPLAATVEKTLASLELTGAATASALINNDPQVNGMSFPKGLPRVNTVSILRTDSLILNKVREEVESRNGTIWPEFTDSILSRWLCEWERGSDELPYEYDESQDKRSLLVSIRAFFRKQLFSAALGLPLLITLTLGSVVVPPGCKDAILDGLVYDLMLWSIVMFAAPAITSFDFALMSRQWKSVTGFFFLRFVIPALILHTVHVRVLGIEHTATAMLCSNFILALLLYPSLDTPAYSIGPEENRSIIKATGEKIWMKPGARWQALNEIQGALLGVSGVLAPLVFMILDSLEFMPLAADPENHWFVRFAMRPLISMLFRIFSVALSNRVTVVTSGSPLLLILYPATVYWANGLMAARGAANCSTYGELAVYISSDYAIILLQMVLFVDARRKFFHGTSLPGASIVAWVVMPFGRPKKPPPSAFQHCARLRHAELLASGVAHTPAKYDALATYVHTIYHMLLKQTGSTAGLFTIIVFYPVMHLFGSSETMWVYFFPLGEKSFYFVLVNSVLDQLQDLLSHVCISEKSGYSFGGMATWQFSIKIVMVLWAIAWLPLLMSTAGWTFVEDGIILLATNTTNAP